MRVLRPERKLLFAILAGGAPGVLVAILFVVTWDAAKPLRWLVLAGIIMAWLVGAAVVRNRVSFRLRTVSNLLAALREGDYSFRVRGGGRGDALAELVLELNLLARKMREERFGDVESTALLGKVMAEIDVVVLAFDVDRKLRLVNPAGARLLGSDEAGLLGRDADELGLAECLDGSPARTVRLPFHTATDRWELRRGVFRQQGRRQYLLVLSDVSRALRAEELAAWQRIIRVLGHELRNSLAPIKSIAGSLEDLVARDPMPGDWREDVTSGLSVIASRADALNRLMSAYAQLARLPQPKLAAVDVAGWVRRVASLETRITVRVSPGPDVRLSADGDQLDQLLINLVRNAVDAALETGGAVEISWRRRGAFLEVAVDDQGPGLAGTASVFVPFFTTKSGGAGIGLPLSRQIAEAHGGSVSLTNREGARGCRALVRLPLPIA